MNVPSRWKGIALLSSLSLVAACSSDPPQQSAAPAAAPVSSAKPLAAPPRAAQPAPAPRQQAAPARPQSADPFSDPKSPLSKRSVFYDYDEYTVRTEFRPVVEAHAAYLRANPGARVGIEGNCDERGSREYNLALGQKRADAVKSMLMVMGVSEKQIETTSNGEEKPRTTGTEETAWSQNRRSDIVYTKQK
jgi:peptidoglycan-associated lipoprotein